MESVLGPRSRYRSAWIAAVGVVTAIGAASALVFVPLSADVIVFALVGSMYGSLHFCAGLSQDITPRALLGPVASGSARAALAALGVLGYAAAAGPETLLLLLAIAGTSPRVVTHLSEPPVHPREPRRPKRAATRKPTNRFTDADACARTDSRVDTRTDAGAGPDLLPDTEADAAVPPAVWRQPVQLSIDELCFAWRRSFADLRRASTAEQRLSAVRARAGMLGELEHRDPRAFAQWIDSGPRAAGDPTRSFTHRPNPGQAG